MALLGGQPQPAVPLAGGAPAALLRLRPLSSPLALCQHRELRSITGVSAQHGRHFPAQLRRSSSSGSRTRYRAPSSSWMGCSISVCSPPAGWPAAAGTPPAAAAAWRDVRRPASSSTNAGGRRRRCRGRAVRKMQQNRDCDMVPSASWMMMGQVWKHPWRAVLGERAQIRRSPGTTRLTGADRHALGIGTTLRSCATSASKPSCRSAPCQHRSAGRNAAVANCANCIEDLLRRDPSDRPGRGEGLDHKHLRAGDRCRRLHRQRAVPAGGRSGPPAGATRARQYIFTIERELRQRFPDASEPVIADVRDLDR